jgi:hypothetical protein
MGTGGGPIESLYEPTFALDPEARLLTSDAVVLGLLSREDEDGVAFPFALLPPKNPPNLLLAGVITWIGLSLLEDEEDDSAKGSRERKSWLTLETILLIGRKADRLDEGEDGEPECLSSSLCGIGECMVGYNKYSRMYGWVCESDSEYGW